MTRSPSYLSQNRYGYNFRIHIPPDLQTYWSKKELKRSLQTVYLTQARSRAMLMGGQCKQLFRWIRIERAKGKMTDAELQEIVDVFMAYMGDADLSGFMGEIVDSNNVTPERLRDMINKAKDARRRYSYAVDTGEGMAELEPVLDDLIYTPGFLENPPLKGSPEYRVLCHKIAEAMRAKWGAYQEYQTERLAGAYGSVSDGVVVQAAAEPVDEGQLLSVVIKMYADEKKKKKGRKGGWTEKSEEEIVDGSLGLFKQIVGDVPIQKIDRKKVAAFKRTIVRLPSNMNKKPEYRDKTIGELVEMDIEEVLAPRTVNKHLGRVRTFFTWAKENGEYQGDNPAPKGMNIPLDSDADNIRAPYSIKDLTNIFNAEGYTNNTFSRSYMFWTPIIALFHGMRQNEIAQLHLADIKKAGDGTWVFDVNNLGDKRTKTDPSQRLVPIHPFLMNDLGILKLKRKLLEEGHERLFPEITPTRDGYGAPVSKWYNQRFKHKIDLEQDPRDRWKDFHSFRKTFSSYVAYKDVSKDRIRQVIGHSTGSDTLTRHYLDRFKGKGLLEKVLKEANFNEKIDLSHLKKSQYVVK